MEITMNLPKYTCHKQVQAVKIHDIVTKGDKLFISPEDKGIDNIEVDRAFLEKHHPEIGGYFVVYEDGYQSYSPADTFESGYTAHDPANHPLRILADVHTVHDAEGTGVRMGVVPKFEDVERYIDAWAKVREIIGLPSHALRILN
jgi:hypothetical protein